MRLITLSLSLIALLGCAVPASAQFDMYRVSVEGPGGGLFADICNGSDVLVGFNFSSGTALNTIAGVCQSQNNGVLFGADHGLNTHGRLPPDGGIHARFTTTGTPRCPPGQAIGEMTVSLDKYKEVERIVATCVGLLPGQNLPHTTFTATTEGKAATTKHIACDTGDIANGIIGRSGTLIDGVGIQCATFPWSRIATGPVPPPPSPPPVTHYITVLKDAQIFPGCGDNSGVAKTQNGIEVDLKTGQASVQLKQVGGPPSCNNWFLLSWPNAPTGADWVYSGPDYTALDPTTLAAAEAALGGGH
jgi:hypothetical protein